MQADAIHQWQLRWPHPTPQLWCLRWLAHPAAGTVTPGHVARQNPYSQYATGMHVASIASSSSSSRGKLQQCAATGAWPYNGQRPPCRALPPPFAVLRRYGLCVRHPQCTPSSSPPPSPPVLPCTYSLYRLQLQCGRVTAVYTEQGQSAFISGRHDCNALLPTAVLWGRRLTSHRSTDR